MGLGKKTKRAKQISEKQKMENGNSDMTGGPSATKKWHLSGEEDIFVTFGTSTTNNQQIPVEEEPSFGSVMCKVCVAQDGLGTFSVVSTLGDGNCLFRALSYCIHKNQQYFHLIRKSIVNYITNHWDDFSYNIVTVTNLYEIAIQSADDYKRYMLQNGTYGGHVELVAASHLFKCNIHVMVKDEINCIDNEEGDRLFHLLYRRWILWSLQGIRSGVR